MNTLIIDVHNIESLKLLENLAKLGLINIHKEKTIKSKEDDFMDLVQRIRSKSQNPPSLEEITAEVEQQRTEMYAVLS